MCTPPATCAEPLVCESARARLTEWRSAAAEPDSGCLAGDLGDHLGSVRGGDRQGLVPADTADGDGLAAAHHVGRHLVDHGASPAERAGASGLADRSRLRRELDDDELGDLPVVCANSAGYRGDHRVPWTTRCRRHQFASSDGSDLGAPRRGQGSRCWAFQGHVEPCRELRLRYSRALRGPATSCSARKPVVAGLASPD